MNTASWNLFEAEARSLDRGAPGRAAVQSVRSAAAELLRSIVVHQDPATPLVTLLERAAENPSSKHSAAVIALRLLALPQALAEDQQGTGERRILSVIEKGAPDILRQYVREQRAQTFEQVDALRAVYNDVRASLAILQALPADADAILAGRQDILRALNNKLVASFLAPYGGRKLSLAIQGMLRDLDLVATTNDHTFIERLTHLRNSASSYKQEESTNLTFLAQDYFLPFVSTLLDAVQKLESESTSRFHCQLGTRIADSLTLTLEKRFPLHDPDRVLTIPIPLLNSGPGVAVGVIATYDLGEQQALVASPTVPLGDIPPGEFSVTPELMVLRPVSELSISVRLEWGTVSSHDRSTAELTCRIRAQSSETDWTALRRREPYSTTPAEGRDFVGRRDKVDLLCSRLTKDRMQSSYITGHKRVGKSSLALAVRDTIRSGDSADLYEFLYLEYGEYAHEDPRSTLRALGERVAEFLLSFVPDGSRPPAPVFTDTLAPLARICDLLLKHVPSKRFVIILDEFDEIPQELYRLGALAETFFANLRTLTAKRNLAVLLVGGENMPFIVAAQGDQLNKFVRESLSYFSRGDEWGDYVTLVRMPAGSSLNWHESAINELFTITNGHPYYTKLLCARVYSTAVSERDTDISVSEVRRAVEHLVSSLDTNAFAHLWRDGIQARSREEVEVRVLQRCRVFVALGRATRGSLPLTAESVTKLKHTPHLQTHEIAPILADMCRRGILEESSPGEYSFVVPLFGAWNAQCGITRLVADTLGDELAAGLALHEDRAYVTDNEIGEVARSWQSYRGRPITNGDVRHWLSQADRFTDQRLLFKLLQHVRFFTEMEIRENLRLAHSLVLKSIPEFVRRSRADRRKDVLVTYVDGPGKSGQFYASRYAEENLISSNCVVEMAGFGEKLDKLEADSDTSVNGLVIVDDIIGTGRSLTENLSEFLKAHHEALRLRNAFVMLVALCATAEGEYRLRGMLRKLDGISCDLRVCEPLGKERFAFPEGDKGFWDSPDEAAEAKALCVRLGSRVAKSAPLGYGQQGLLIVFPQSCPNNSLPILHASRSGEEPWSALFPRAKN